MIVVLDYGIGNINSVVNMLRKVGAEVRPAGDPITVARASALVLPGVGAFDRGMEKLARSGLLPVLEEAVLERGTAILGICLGMQLMTRCSAEGGHPGLGWIDARTVKFDFGPNPDRLKIPHMGWNTVQPAREVR